MAPDQSRVEGGEALEQALGDEADLDMAVMGGEFSADGRAVGRGFVMEELVALKSAGRRHRAHPEMIRPGADAVERLLETDLDVEAQGVEPDDLGRSEREVGGPEQNLATVGMSDGHKADDASGGTPEQVATALAQGDGLLGVDRAGPGREGPGEKIAQADFGAVKFWLARPGRRGLGGTV